MTAMIDTLKFAKNFEIAGFAKPQAEALTAAMAEMTQSSREDLVTKTDLGHAVSDLRSDIKVAVAELKIEIISVNATTKSQILWTLLGTQFFVIGAFAMFSNLNKFFH